MNRPTRPGPPRPRPEPERRPRDLPERLRDLADRHARQLHRDAVLAWAKTDDGPYPPYAESFDRAVADLETLVRALDAWAAPEADPFLEVRDHDPDGFWDFLGPFSTP